MDMVGHNDKRPQFVMPDSLAISQRIRYDPRHPRILQIKRPRPSSIQIPVDPHEGMPCRSRMRRRIRCRRQTPMKMPCNKGPLLRNPDMRQPSATFHTLCLSADPLRIYTADAPPTSITSGAKERLPSATVTSCL